MEMDQPDCTREVGKLKDSYMKTTTIKGDDLFSHRSPIDLKCHPAVLCGAAPPTVHIGTSEQRTARARVRA